MDITITPCLMSQEHHIVNSLCKAGDIVQDFALEHGWEHLLSSELIRHAHVLGTKSSLDGMIRERANILRGQRLPVTLAATVLGDELFITSPAVFHQIYPSAMDSGGYVPLIAHEMIHLLHIRILSGDEAAMGPEWFYEGVALYGAGQFAQLTAEHGTLELLAALEGNCSDYRVYLSILRKLLSEHKLKDLIIRAKEIRSFEAWARSVLLCKMPTD